jgi:hypothetical protein
MTKFIPNVILSKQIFVRPSGEDLRSRRISWKSNHDIQDSEDLQNLFLESLREAKELAIANPFATKQSVAFYRPVQLLRIASSHSIRSRSSNAPRNDGTRRFSE